MSENRYYFTQKFEDSGTPITIPQNETHKVFDNKIVLDTVPDEFTRVKVTSINGVSTNDLVEIPYYEDITDVNEFKVDYKNGSSFVYFHPSREAQSIGVSYKGKGYVCIMPNRIATIISEDGKTILQTLAQKIDEFQTQGNYAKNQGDYAKEQGDSANSISNRLSIWESYDNTKTYYPLNKVIWQSSSYICISPCQGIEPHTDPTKWLMIVKKGNDGIASYDEVYITVTSNASSHIVHNMTFDPVHDVLKVIECEFGTELVKGVNYSENTDNKSIDLIGWTVDTGFQFRFELYKGMNDATLQQVVDDSIVKKNDLQAVVDDSVQKKSDLQNVINTADLTSYASRGDVEQINSQLNDIPNKTYITEKAKTADVNNSIANLQNQINGIGTLRFINAYASLSALQTAYPTGTNGIALVTADGYGYYWNGSAWTKGTQFQSTGIAENGINTLLLSDNAISVSKTDRNIANLLGIENLTLGWVLGSIQSGNINSASHDGASTNNFIVLDNDVKITLNSSSNAKFIVAYYTLSGVFTGSYSAWFTADTVIAKQSDRQIRICIKYNDGSLFTDIYPLIQNISVIKETNSVNKLNTRVSAVEVSINSLNSGIVVPSHWTSHIDSKINTIKNLQKSIGFNGTSFAFITDIHIGNNSQNSGKLLQKIMTDCEIPYYYDGGDFVTGAANTTKAQNLADISLVKTLFKPLEDRCLRAIGNHDDNSIDGLYSKTLIDIEMYNAVYRQNSKYQKYKNGRTGEYFYIDDEMHKIRYITLDCIDIPYVNPSGDTLQYAGMSTWAFRQEQIDWFADVALNVPNNTWSVVVCSHIPINQGLIKNDSIMMNILQAFKDKSTYTGSNTTDTDFLVNKSVNYTGKGGDVICWISGHQHRDAFITLPGNITYPEIVSLNDSLDVVSGQATKTLGTSTENAFDIFTINKLARTVNITRIGAGSDRSFTY